MDPELFTMGTCSWKYDSWRGLVYPETGSYNPLQVYARRYKTVEIDQWFWSLHGPGKLSLPDPNVVQEYLESVPSSFRFTIKAPNSVTLTHFYTKHPNAPLEVNPDAFSPGLFESFLQRIEPLLPQTDSIMLQFGYLNRKKMVSMRRFFERLAGLVEPFSSRIPIGIEIRNPNYLTSEYFEHLSRLNCHHVFLQGYYMPDIVEVYDRFGALPGERTVIRLHGPDRKGMDKKSKGIWNRLMEERDDELTRISRMILDCLSRHVKTIVNVNNHYEGSAPLTIERLEEKVSLGTDSHAL
jgi:uncharacterized protein YecE (DUF72 family)